MFKYFYYYHICNSKRLYCGQGRNYAEYLFYLRALPDEFLLKSTLVTTDFKRNSSGRMRRYEYSPPPSPPLPINALVSALTVGNLLLRLHH